MKSNTLKAALVAICSVAAGAASAGQCGWDYCWGAVGFGPGGAYGYAYSHYSETDAYNAAFPERRFADVRLVLKNGQVLSSPRTEALGDPEAPIGWDGIVAKFRGAVDDEQAEPIIRAVDTFELSSSMDPLIQLIY